MEENFKIKENINLASLTTFKIGGRAKYFIEIKTEDDLSRAFLFIKEKKLKYFLLAGGSNVLINDADYNGAILKINNDEIKIKSERLECGAGASLARAARLSAGKGLYGLEWAINIPGTVGGAARGNAGAYGKSISKLIEIVKVFNKKKKKFILMSQKDCQFGYKDSVFKRDDNLIIWQIILKLRKDSPARLAERIRDYSSRRQASQPNLPSAGCAFKNIAAADLRKNNARLYDLAEREKTIKGGMVSAGWIIDQLGIKGKTIGGAKISLEHANFIVNTGRARAEEVVMLISYIKQQARTKFNIQLVEEIVYLGF